MSLKKFHLKINNDIELKVPVYTDALELLHCVNVTRKALEKYMIWAKNTNTIDDVLKFINLNNHDSIYDKDFPLCIWYKNKIVGIAGFNNGDKYKKTVDIGYWISNEYTGIGIVTKVCKALINFAFSLTDVKSIYIKCEVTNTKSYAIAQRLEFEFVSQEKGGCFVKDGDAETITYVLRKG